MKRHVLIFGLGAVPGLSGLRPNGKAERFIQTAINEWAYARTYQNSAERQAQLDPWLHDYNFHRKHASLNHNTPASRAGLNRNNLLSLHT